MSIFHYQYTYSLYVVSVITNITGSQIRQIRLWSFQLGLFRKKTSNIYNHDIDITESERYLQTSDYRHDIQRNPSQSYRHFLIYPGIALLEIGIPRVIT
jgi:hypothetical protein